MLFFNAVVVAFVFFFSNFLLFLRICTSTCRAFPWRRRSSRPHWTSFGVWSCWRSSSVKSLSRMTWSDVRSCVPPRKPHVGLFWSLMDGWSIWRTRWNRFVSDSCTIELIDWWIHRLIDSLVGWLVDWLINSHKWADLNWNIVSDCCRMNNGSARSRIPTKPNQSVIHMTMNSGKLRFPSRAPWRMQKCCENRVITTVKPFIAGITIHSEFPCETLIVSIQKDFF